MIQKIDNQTIEEKKDDLLRVSSIETLELDEVSDILSESENNWMESFLFQITHLLGIWVRYPKEKLYFKKYIP